MPHAPLTRSMKLPAKVATPTSVRPFSWPKPSHGVLPASLPRLPVGRLRRGSARRAGIEHRGFGLGADLLDGDVRSELNQAQAVGGDVQDA